MRTVDWVAYMQEVEGPMLQNDFNYEHLEGQTGPLVYPAGFVYIFVLLRFFSNSGTNIFLAQLLFAGIHTLLIFVVVGGIYSNVNGVPDFALPLVVLSRRVHSIFSLRLFTDGVAMLYAYSSVALAMRNRWTLACILFSLGVSIKMNVLLMAPGLAVLLVQSNGIIGAALRVGLCGLIQLILAGPFIAINPLGYMKRSFDLGRVFLLKWSVNFKFLSEPFFQSPSLAVTLLGLTLFTWLLFGHYRWAKSSGGLFRMVINSRLFERRALNAEHVAMCMLESNLIGIVFARSMHYQFYCWYAHVIPLYAWRSSLGRRSSFLALGMVVAIEVCFNIFPATPLSSFVLQLTNIMLLISIFLSPITSMKSKEEAKV